MVLLGMASWRWAAGPYQNIYLFLVSRYILLRSTLPPRNIFRTSFFSSPANPAPAQGYTSIQEDISYRPTQQSFVYEVEDLVREALKRDIRWVVRQRAPARCHLQL